MKNYFLFVLLPVILLAACEKDDENNDDQNNEQTAVNYYPMQVGNYWVYQSEGVDASGNPTGQTGQDCVVIVKDTTINGELFYKHNKFKLQNGVYKKWMADYYLRDSASCIIDNYGMIHFGHNLINDTIAERMEMHANGTDTLYRLYVIMKKETNPVTVPSGTFNDVLDSRYHVYSNLTSPDISQPLTTHKYYSDNVGIIYFELVYVSAGYKDIYKLLRYNV